MEKLYEAEIRKFGKQLKTIRIKKGFSQLDLELSSGINRTEISRIENGQKNIEFFTVVRLAEALEVDLIELFK